MPPVWTALLRVGGGGGEFTRHARTPAHALYLEGPDRLDRSLAGRYFKLELVAVGSYLYSDASRPILKRCVLSGYPTKVKARFASVRYMFFNPTDVAYFKPVEIYTKDARARGRFPRRPHKPLSKILNIV